MENKLARSVFSIAAAAFQRLAQLVKGKRRAPVAPSLS